MSTFAQWAKERRKGLDLTQAELAELVGCSLITVAKIESGERRPSKQIAELMARHLRVPDEHRAAFVDFARGQTEVPPMLGAMQTVRQPAFTGIPAAAITGRLIGRERELQQIADALQADDARLITLVGPGGVGKTQLALRAAQSVREAFTHGVCFVDAASSRDAAQLTQAMARAMHASDEFDLLAVVRHIAKLNLLLVLDNLEQVAGASSVVAEVIAGCPRVWVLATSREALRLGGERVLPVQPLSVPITVRGEGASTADLAHVPSVALFVERARSADPQFDLTPGNARAVAELCRRLDGLPLALELAAARVGLMTPQALLAKLAPAQRTNIELIGGGATGAPARQRTLRNTIQWSYDLLDTAEQSIFRQLGAFVGGCTLEAAEAVLRSSEGDGAASVWDALAVQLNRSLLQRREGTDGDVRFVQLETIREFAIQQLDAAPDAQDVRRRHAVYFAGLAERAAALLPGRRLQEGLAQLDAEYANLRAALDWLLQHDPPLAQRIAVHLSLYWDVRGDFQEARTVYVACLAANPEPSLDRAWALLGLATLDYNASRLDIAMARCDAALQLCHRFGDKRGIAQALLVMAWTTEGKHNVALAKDRFRRSLTAAREAGDDSILARGHVTFARLFREHEGDLDAADASLEAALAIYRRAGDLRGVAHALMQRSEVAAARGDYATAVRLAGESVVSFRDLGATNELGWALVSLGESQLNAGMLERAQPNIEASLATFERVGVTWGVAISLHHLGRLALLKGERDTARSYYLRSMALCQTLNRTHMTARCLAGLAGVAIHEGDFQRAARLLGAALPHVPGDLTPADQREYQSFEETVRAALGDEAYQAITAIVDLGEAVQIAFA
ncbi:MAG: helix-turn-helix domain-containing protein [Anaerolineae bacterium]|nr:helix-turn-helix domain-containing protein [Candidatus Roseilinea sp.]MDW8448450.1 helix-turn-helix domain-containing protein [Anaerolineae bacterium]